MEGEKAVDEDERGIQSGTSRHMGDLSWEWLGRGVGGEVILVGKQDARLTVPFMLCCVAAVVVSKL